MTVIHYSRAQELQDVAQSWDLYLGSPVWSEDGKGYPVHTARAFTIEGQTEPGHLGELREPFATETMGVMLDGMAEDPCDSITMDCADCGMVPRLFDPCGMAGIEGDKPDYVCTHFGWMQTSTAGGAAELCESATWHNMARYAQYRDIARAGGYSVPDMPPCFVP